MEEFQEADVLWPAPDHHHHNHGCSCHQSSRRSEQQRHPQPAQRTSAPVLIPMAAAGVRSPSWARSCCDVAGDGAGCRDEGVRTTGSAAGAGEAPAAIVPPHVVLAARRCSEERVAAYSLCVGHGRTLKGRDLRAVRNAVLRMTGFLGGADEC